MPVHVPPVSRRDFLKNVLATGGVLCLPGTLWANTPKADPNRWVLMADTHVHADRNKKNHGIKPAENLARARSRILHWRQLPAGVIIAGDCVYIKGRKEDYKTLAEELRPFSEAGVPVHMALGNHDHRENFWEAFPDAVGAGSLEDAGKQVSVIETPYANWILLDSLQATNETPGEFGEAQLQWLAQALDERPEKPAVLLAHHYPARKAKSNGLRDTKAFFDVIKDRKQVKAYIFGHSHAWRHWCWEGIHCVNLPATAWLFRIRQRRGFVEANLRENGMRLNLHPLNGCEKGPRSYYERDFIWRG